MIRGRVNRKFEPVVPITIHGRTPLRMKAVVDTGFSGYLLLSRRQRNQMELRHIGSETYEFADGRLKREPVYLGRITFDGETLTVLVLLTTSRDTLIGASLLKAKRLHISYPKRQVLVSGSAQSLAGF